jgi:hypothetical protein
MKLLLAALAAALALAVPAHADPYDPHYPQPMNGWCPGGSHMADYLAYCEGVPYPDGTRWNMYRVGLVAWSTLRCIAPDGSMNPPLAPPGGCGGAWQG